MGRAPCCEKMGLKKGPWTPEEDLILTNFIHQNGYANWRALPKRAGLSRCGKSCRLRWMNYLRPDIKRGNFSPQEEETIIKLHQQLGNRWSVIAASLPGRTDNEIKNVWNTNLKKRLNKQSGPEPETRTYQTDSSDSDPNSPLYSSTDVSSLANAASGVVTYSSEMDESFWSEVDDCGATTHFSAGNSHSLFEYFNSFCSDMNVIDGSVDFWYNFSRAEDIIELPQF
ncbi:hypothetical protein ACS0TY_007334 [Phlomoides rotata]